jgi:hypothetical protein
MSFAIAIFHSTGKWLKKQPVESQAGQTLQEIGSLSGICVTALPANADSAGISIGTQKPPLGNLFGEEPANTPQHLRVHGRCHSSCLSVLLARMVHAEKPRASAR